MSIEIKQAETGYYRLYINSDCVWNEEWAKHMSPYDTAQQYIYSLAITAEVLSDGPYRYDERESANYYLPGDLIDFA